MKAVTTLLPLAGIAVATLVSGCSHDTSNATTATGSAGVPGRLTAQQVEAKVKAVQNDKTIPDSAKPGVIANIRAQGGSK